MQFDDASMWAIFGPNGAGKSTLLKAVMGLLKCNTGKVSWQGISRRDIAYLPQQADIDRSQPMTVFELAAMGLWYEIGFFGGVNAAQKKRVMQALERVEMAEFAHRQIGHLSNGQFQRVLFARMLAQDAKFLLLDEPFNAVDAKPLTPFWTSSATATTKAAPSSPFCTTTNKCAPISRTLCSSRGKKSRPGKRKTY